MLIAHGSGPTSPGGSSRATILDVVDNYALTDANFGMHVLKTLRPIPDSNGAVPRYGLARNQDNFAGGGSSLQWRGMNQSKGIYDFTALDTWLDAQVTAGVKVAIINFSFTPDWAAANQTANGKALYGAPYSGTDGQTDAQRKAVSKCNLPPDDPQDWYNFHVAASIHCAAKYAGKITIAPEGWNEPNNQGFWSGTLAQLAQLQRLMYQAWKANFPSCIVLSPTYVSPAAPGYTIFGQYLNASDGAGGFGKQWFDAPSYHYYVELSYNAISIWSRAHLGLTKVLAANGLATDGVWCSEVGCTNPAFSTQTDSQQADLLDIYIIMAFAVGVRYFAWYAHDSTGSDLAFGTKTGGYNPVLLNPLYNARVASLSGKTIVRRRVYQDSPTAVTAVIYLSDGSIVSKTLNNMPLVSPN